MERSPLPAATGTAPNAQTQARNQWIAARTRDLVPLSYFHIVFTVPHQLSELMLQNKRVLYDLLFQSVAATLKEVAANPEHLGAEIGFLGVLHTWGQTLVHHPHIHCVVPAGGFAPGRNAWVRPRYPRFFLPVLVLSEVFRGKFIDGLTSLFRRKKLAFHGSLKWLEDPRSFAHFLQTPSPSLGGLRQEAFWRTGTRIALSGALYPPGGDFQPSADCDGGWQGHLPLEGLCPSRQEAQDDFGGRRVPPALPVARAAQGFCAHPALRLDG